MTETTNGVINPAQLKYSGLVPIAGTMQFGTTTANAKKTSTTFASVLAIIKRLGIWCGMVA